MTMFISFQGLKPINGLLSGDKVKPVSSFFSKKSDHIRSHKLIELENYGSLHFTAVISLLKGAILDDYYSFNMQKIVTVHSTLF